MSGTNVGQLIPFRVIRQSDLSRAVMAFVVDREARGLSARTLEYYGEELERFQVYAEGRGAHSVERVTAALVREFLLDTGQRRNAGGTHAAFRAVRAFVRWAWCEFELSQPCPIAKVKPPRVPTQLLDPLPLPDLKRMLATCERGSLTGTRDRALLLCLLDSGARASEFLALDLSDLDAASGALTLRHAKGGKVRTVYLGAKARRELLRYLRRRPDQGALWLTDDSHRLTYPGLVNLVKRRARAAGVPVPSLHSFRRAFGLGMLRGGCNVYALQRLMGHSDLGTLRRYLAQTETDLQQAHAGASPVDRLL